MSAGQIPDALSDAGTRHGLATQGGSFTPTFDDATGRVIDLDLRGRLVDDARKNGVPQQKRRAAREAAYQFMLAIAGDLPGYEEATRALFADDRRGLEQRIADWPEDIRAHALRLAFGAPD